MPEIQTQMGRFGTHLVREVIFPVIFSRADAIPALM
jgi:hypothetical protein